VVKNPFEEKKMLSQNMVTSGLMEQFKCSLWKSTSEDKSSRTKELYSHFCQSTLGLKKSHSPKHRCWHLLTQRVTSYVLSSRILKKPC